MKFKRSISIFVAVLMIVQSVTVFAYDNTEKSIGDSVTLEQILSDTAAENGLDMNDGIWMNITNQSITDERLSYIVASDGIPECVTTLSLEDNLISDVSSLTSLTHLKHLYLWGNPVVQEQIYDLQKALPHLVIEWDGNSLSRSLRTTYDKSIVHSYSQSEPTRYWTAYPYMQTTGLGWSMGTSITYNYSSGIVSYVSVNLSSSSSPITHVQREGTALPYPRNPNFSQHTVVSYFRASQVLGTIWSIWCHTINCYGDGSYWGWASETLYGSVPVTY